MKKSKEDIVHSVSGPELHFSIYILISLALLGFVVWAIMEFTWLKPRCENLAPTDDPGYYQLCEMLDGRFEIYKAGISSQGRAWLYDGTLVKIWPIGWTCRNRLQAEKAFKDTLDAKAKGEAHEIVLRILAVGVDTPIEEYLEARENE